MEHIRKPKPKPYGKKVDELLRGYGKLLSDAEKPLPPVEWYSRKRERNEDT